MGTRGRKSLSDMAVVTPMRRPGVPSELDDEQGQVWRSVVSSLAADWFSQENYPLLIQYCRHVVNARRVAQMLDAALSDDETKPRDLMSLMAAQREESRAIAALGRSMRLTQQTHYSDRKTKGGSSTPPPWEAK